jgi:hypothetical protein
MAGQQVRPPRVPTAIASDIVAVIHDTKDEAERLENLAILAREAVHLPSIKAAEMYQKIFQLATSKKAKGRGD